MQMNPTETAILLVGYQNDFFRADGLLHGAVGEEIQNRNVLTNTLRLLERALFSGVTVVSTPIAFTDDYRELENPVGILKTIKELGAFRKSSPGSRTVDALQKFSDRIVELPGKQGLCSFSNTGLDSLLQERGIKNVVIAGVVTSVCIDSTARVAADKGYNVSILSDCTAGRSAFEQEFYCNEIFPIFSTVSSVDETLASFANRVAA